MDPDTLELDDIVREVRLSPRVPLREAEEEFAATVLDRAFSPTLPPWEMYVLR